MPSETIKIEVAYAKPDRQVILEVEAEQGITAKEAVLRSGILDEFPEIDIETAKLGIFGKAAAATAVLKPFDRVEIYRPLIADPKEARKKRAAQGKQLKNRAVKKKAPRKPATKPAPEKPAENNETAESSEQTKENKPG
jgi:putative ubiquitin-RnfH superfamily antitoxin RatB of RatAB toxin-antitoxin module